MNDTGWIIVFLLILTYHEMFGKFDKYKKWLHTSVTKSEEEEVE